MKDISEIVACVVDYGSFLSLADCLGRKTSKTYYHSPWEQEFVGVDKCVIGDGFEHFERLDDPLDPDVFDKIDLWVFPDINFKGLQRHLRELGKLVFGSMGASDLELYRTRFLKVIEKVGLPVVHSITIQGLTNLSLHLREVEDRWIKINRFRDDMETWHHQDYEHSEAELSRMAVKFGPLKERVVFVVQEPINDDDGEPVLELGYDGWSVDGWFPDVCFQGYEAKNELYLGSKLAYERLPEAVRQVNEAMSPTLAEYGYRNFWATEIRIKGDQFSFIDPTARMAGQTQEHLLTTCSNLPEIILAGAQGEMLAPEFSANFAAEATMHYKSANKGEGFKTLRVPEEIEEWVKLYHCCRADGAYHFPPHKTDEVGVICGAGDTIPEALEDLSRNFDHFKGEPVTIETMGFAELIEQIQTAQKEGVEFTDQPVPGPEIILESK